MDNQNLSLREDYLASLPEQIENIEYILMQIDQNGMPDNSWDEFLRIIHSIKGTAGSFEVNFVSTVCHELETYLSTTSPRKLHVELCLPFVDLLSEYIANYLDAGIDFDESVFDEKLRMIAPSGEAGKFKVLIVENTHVMSDYYAQTLLEKSDVIIVNERVGVKAFERLMSEDYDALFTSMYIGDLDGPSLISSLKVSRGPNRNIPTFLITSDLDKAVSGTGFDADFILKKSGNLHDELLLYYDDIFNKRFFVGAVAQRDRGELTSILCIDDDELILGLVKLGLKKFSPSPQVEFADSGQGAITKLENYRPDLIIMDVNMPEMSGPDTFKILKSNKLTSDIPVIFLTGQQEKKEINALLNLGALGVISKPFDNKKIAGYIDIIWQRKC
jgi:CheY-like chemotaxis protein/HPt (histidine-containing phosphotransfer) domain-containing protein